MEQLLTAIRSCQICSAFLPFAPKPVIRANQSAKILIIGQAPGQKVHESGIPWNDQSGKELRRWLQVTPAQFYESSVFAIMPMGLCFPGTGSSGDLPPRKECAPHWHEKVIAQMPSIELTLLIGKYAQDFYLKNLAKANLTLTVQSYLQYLPRYFPLPHPSPRNKIWMKKNPWFESEIIPQLQQRIAAILH